MRTMTEIKLIGQRLAYKRQRNTGNVYMQISYACAMLSFHSLCVPKICNGIRMHSSAFVPFIRILKHISQACIRYNF